MENKLLGLGSGLGNDDQELIDYLNDKNNKIPDYLIYCAMVRQDYNLIDTCIKLGYVLDDKFMSFACFIFDSKLIKMCLDNNILPSEDVIHDMLIFCTLHTRGQPRPKYKIETDVDKYYCNLEEKKILQKNRMYYFLVYHILYSDRPFWGKRLCNKYFRHFLNNVVGNLVIFGKYASDIDEKAKKAIDSVNLILNSKYVMTSNDWNLLLKSRIPYQTLQINIGDLNNLISLNNEKANKYIISYKLSTNDKSLEIAIKSDNLDIIQYIVNVEKKQLDSSAIKLIIERKNEKIIIFFLQNHNGKFTTTEIDSLYDISFTAKNMEMINCIFDKYNVIPKKEIIVKHIQSFPSFKFLFDNNLISINEKDTDTINTNALNNLTIKKKDTAPINITENKTRGRKKKLEQ